MNLFIWQNIAVNQLVFKTNSSFQSFLVLENEHLGQT